MVRVGPGGIQPGPRRWFGLRPGWVQGGSWGRYRQVWRVATWGTTTSRRRWRFELIGRETDEPGTRRLIVFTNPWVVVNEKGAGRDS